MKKRVSKLTRKKQYLYSLQTKEINKVVANCYLIPLILKEVKYLRVVFDNKSTFKQNLEMKTPIPSCLGSQRQRGLPQEMPLVSWLDCPVYWEVTAY